MQREIKRSSLEVIEDKEKGGLLLQLVSGMPGDEDGATKQVSPEALLAVLVKHLKQLAEEYVGGPVGASVLTVPADFNAQQCEAIVASCRQAGLDVLQTLIEPCAIALAHGLDRVEPEDDIVTAGADDDDDDDDEVDLSADDELVLVVDLGSTQLDVTLLGTSSGCFRLRSSSVDTSLGAEQFEGKLAAHCVAQFKRQYKVDPSESAKAMAKLNGMCGGAMRALSALQQTDLDVDSLFEGYDLRVRLSRARFDDLCSSLYRQLSSALTVRVTF